VRYLLLVATLLLLIACASGSRKEILYEEKFSREQADALAVGWMDNPNAVFVLDQAPAPRALAASRASGGFNDGYAESYAENIIPRESARMVNYNGDIRMQNARPEAVIDTVIERAKAKGGSVNNRRNGFVSLQIPVDDFKEFFEFILTLGNVTSKNISASDITDAFTDNAARLRIAERALARLQELLAVAKAEQEKIALLKEIQRLSDQIESMKLEEKDLLRRAAFSTITLSVSNIPPPVAPVRIDIKAFKWFSDLPKDASSHPDTEKPLKMQVPKDFIETKTCKHIWSAASALNTKFWAYEKKNKPQGTADFWANAMHEFFKSQYSVELKTEENYYLIRLQSFRAKIELEIYYIAILKSSNKKRLKIAQAYFQNKEAEEKNSEAIKEILRRAK
jgi:hypothetical protein